MRFFSIKRKKTTIQDISAIFLVLITSKQLTSAVHMEYNTNKDDSLFRFFFLHTMNIMQHFGMNKRTYSMLGKLWIKGYK